MKEYTITAEFKKKNREKALKLIEKILGVSIEDEFMFAAEKESVTIFGLTKKEEGLLMDKLLFNKYITDCSSQLMAK